MINKVPVKKLIEFRRLSEKRKSSFGNKLTIPKETVSNDSGNDYWTRSLSGLSTAFKQNDNLIIKGRIERILDVYEDKDDKKTKLMYDRNLNILHNYEDFNFMILRPSIELNFLPKPRILINISGLPIQVIPHQIFSYKEKEEMKVGGIWFVIWLKEFKESDLGIYSEALYRYLLTNYSKEYVVDPNYCLIVDALSMGTVTYQQILLGEIAPLLETTIDMVNKHIL